MKHWKRWALALCVVLLIGGIVGALAGYHLNERKHRPTELDVSECFTPRENCTQFIVNAIRELGTKEILVQAYNYTSPEIISALAQAKGRGVDVRVLLDKSNEQERYSGGVCTEGRGIPVLTDSKPNIAHNKVMVFDGKHTLTGSFNFTVAAQKSNAENVMLVRNWPPTARRYQAYWEERKSESRQFRPKATSCALAGQEND